jgi:hypothetical protein
MQSIFVFFSQYLSSLCNPGFDSTSFALEESMANISWHTLGLQERNRAPISTVPFDRDRKFVGRQAILTALESQFSHADSHNRVVLAGLGGVGYALTYYRYF